MKKQSPKYPCSCQCHETLVFHVSLMCDCGKPVVPPGECGTHRPPKRECCPPPPDKLQPGTVNIPQDDPPPRPNTSDVPPWKVGKPKPGDAGEIPWFRGKIGDINRNGPTFGPRKDEYLPFLVVRAASGDRGNRPIGGVFWESPDIFVAPNLEANTAPAMPPTTAGVAKASLPNTLYAHVWNLGKAPAYRVRVEFYWFNPSLGINRSDANLIGAAWVDIGNRCSSEPRWREVQTSYGKWMSRGSHVIVRCPETWVPTIENNGHECLVVRAFECILDATPVSQFNAARDRHVAQRNISVVEAASPATLDLTLNLGYPDSPSEAEVEIQLEDPAKMEWLQLYAHSRSPGYHAPVSKVIAGLLPPTATNARTIGLQQVALDCREQLLKIRERFHRGCDPLRIGFHATAVDLKEHEAQVVRIRQRIGSDVIGGYSVILIK